MPNRRTVDHEVYITSAKSRARVIDAAAADAAARYKIELRFLGGLNATQKEAFKTSADRWARVIVGDLPRINVEGDVIDGLLVMVQGAKIDPSGGIIGQAGPTHIRPASAGKSKFLPVKGIITLDTAQLAKLSNEGRLNDFIAHAMGHVLGIGTIWDRKGLMKDTGRATIRFAGKNAKRELGKLTKKAPADVPVENAGGPGTADHHWSGAVLPNELMSSVLDASSNPLSRITVASLQDLGYEVDLSMAEPYMPPVQSRLADMTSRRGQPHTLPVLPIQVPDSSVVD